MPAQPPSSATIALLQRHSLTSAVQAELERMILSGELGPGARLTETALAARLGVSRGPLREAFRMLGEAGLVRAEKNRGVFVREIAADEVDEILDLRAAIDALVGRRVARRVDATTLAELRELADALDAASAARDALAWESLDRRFHDRLVELSGNRRLMAIDRQLAKELSLVRSAAPRAGSTLSSREHRRIVAALAAGDAGAAGAAMAAHALQRRRRNRRAPTLGQPRSTEPASVA
ncbi:FCD domain-containing protein [Piscinibacter koreensis]|uniref:FCD domain-containing protein n=1 Tax=Piscinibacter koreensis TaxID=2742824 RepID=A0A7Y6NRT5_9BURK|nr:FCD domain-containing protein [Schlegelella koreensis]NUZ08161.1 FCD domain-containing protein [Schlegelella koreensis]